MIEIIIHNLIDNALKHTYGQVIHIAVTQAEKDTIELTITDSGFGMDDGITDWLNRIYDAVSADFSNPPQTPPNLGLGLIMVKEITMLLGIRIKAVSTHEGTTIMLIFNR
ncbi:sensor histidine kinase [Dyadobacter sp. LHD-138]|uniref:sensor histidine kinase n=1 Tax=Dyadobacter sp. LHD-138 TaxID=3071413 RepID=UPI0027E04FCB|nr:sensor histidine kinase [Dyadobacter sp. LHD-138]MDQ6480563.1 sensor histidine kinase [Dyadobacter sp. LHD-138]